MKHRQRLMLLIGVVLALMAGGGLYYLYQNNIAQIRAQMDTAIVATKQISRYTLIDDKNASVLFVARQFPKEAIPDDAIRRMTDIKAGLVTQTTIYKDQFIIKDYLSTAQAQTTSLAVDNRMKNGRVAMSLTLSELGVLAGGVQPNDVVDILVTYSPTIAKKDSTQPASGKQPTSQSSGQGGKEGAASQGSGVGIASAGGQSSAEAAPPKATWMLLKSVLVLNVGSNYVPNPENPTKAEAVSNRLTTVTLLLTPEEATILKFLRDDGSVFDFLLHRAGDETDFGQPLITSEDIVRHYLEGK